MSIMESQSTILFRSDDLNGATAEILIKAGTNINLLKTNVCTIDNIDELLEEFINSGEYQKYKNIFIIGLKFSRKNADLLTKLVNEEELKVIYRDHHKESLDLSRYMWGRILIWDRYGHEISSCKYLFRELISRDNKKYVRLAILVDLVNASITSYKPEEDLDGAKTIEQLYEMANSSSDFVDSMTKKILSNDAFFNEQDVLEAIERQKREEAEREAKLAELRNRRTNRNKNSNIFFE